MGDELSTSNLEFECLTHGFGPGVVSLVVTKLKDKHQELSESISPLVLKIGISDPVPIDVLDEKCKIGSPKVG